MRTLLLFALFSATLGLAITAHAADESSGTPDTGESPTADSPGVNEEASGAASEADDERALAAVASFADGAAGLIVPAGTPLALTLVETLESQRNEVGDEVLFILSEDVVLLGQTVLVAGTPVLGIVTKAKASKSWGRSGSVQVEVDRLVPPYGNPIPVRDTFGESERANLGEMIPTMIFGGLLQGGSIDGEKIKIRAGTQLSVFTEADGRVRGLSAEEMRDSVQGWTHDCIVRNFLDFCWKGRVPVVDAFEERGYTVTSDMVSFSPLEAFQYQISVSLPDGEAATFQFAPFDDVHRGNTGFKPLFGLDELGRDVMKRVK